MNVLDRFFAAIWRRIKRFVKKHIVDDYPYDPDTF